jgi:hypothetical protein
MRFTIGSSTARTWLIALAAAVAASCLTVAAFGSSKGSSTVAHAASSGPAHGNHAPSPPPGPDPARYKAVRECLSKNGVTLPRPPVLPPRGAPIPPGAPMPPGAPLRPGPPPAKAMNGAKRAHIRAALRKCGAPAPPLGCNEARPGGYPRHGRHRP